MDEFARFDEFKSSELIKAMYHVYLLTTCTAYEKDEQGADVFECPDRCNDYILADMLNAVLGVLKNRNIPVCITGYSEHGVPCYDERSCQTQNCHYRAPGQIVDNAINDPPEIYTDYGQAD